MVNLGNIYAQTENSKKYLVLDSDNVVIKGDLIVDGTTTTTTVNSSVPAFRATSSLTTQYLPNNATTLIPFNNTDGTTHWSFDICNNFNTSTGKFTAPVAGIYFFYCSILYTPVNYTQNFSLATLITTDASNSNNVVALLKKQAGANEAWNTHYTQSVTGSIKLSANENVGVYSYNTNSSGNQVSYYPLATNVFGGHLIQRL